MRRLVDLSDDADSEKETLDRLWMQKTEPSDGDVKEKNELRRIATIAFVICQVIILVYALAVPAFRISHNQIRDLVIAEVLSAIASYGALPGIIYLFSSQHSE